MKRQPYNVMNSMILLSIRCNSKKKLHNTVQKRVHNQNRLEFVCVKIIARKTARDQLKFENAASDAKLMREMTAKLDRDKTTKALLRRERYFTSDINFVLVGAVFPEVDEDKLIMVATLILTTSV